MGRLNEKSTQCETTDISIPRMNEVKRAESKQTYKRAKEGASRGRSEQTHERAKEGASVEFLTDYAHSKQVKHWMALVNIRLKHKLRFPKMAKRWW